MNIELKSLRVRIYITRFELISTLFSHYFRGNTRFTYKANKGNRNNKMGIMKQVTAEVNWKQHQGSCNKLYGNCDLGASNFGCSKIAR